MRRGRLLRAVPDAKSGSDAARSLIICSDPCQASLASRIRVLFKDGPPVPHERVKVARLASKTFECKDDLKLDFKRLRVCIGLKI